MNPICSSRREEALTNLAPARRQIAEPHISFYRTNEVLRLAPMPFANSRAGAPRCCPGRTSDNSPAFQRWEMAPVGMSPARTAERFVTRLADAIGPGSILCRPSGTTDTVGRVPSVETLGYFLTYLR